MKTSKPFSTISYNSVEFLRMKLEDLVRRNVLSFYAFVKHYAEEDELKAHIHLICFPNGQYQTDPLGDYLTEANPSDFTKPFGIMPCQSSKFGDWFLYACHDSAYLASKNQTRKHHYTEADFVSSNSDYLHELVHTIDRSKYEKTLDFVNAVKSGKRFEELVKAGYVPVSQFNQWASMYAFLNGSSPYPVRNERITHTPRMIEKPEIITEDGEIIDCKIIECPEDELPFPTDSQ